MEVPDEAAIVEAEVKPFPESDSRLQVVVVPAHDVPCGPDGHVLGNIDIDERQIAAQRLLQAVVFANPAAVSAAVQEAILRQHHGEMVIDFGDILRRLRSARAWLLLLRLSRVRYRRNHECNYEECGNLIHGVISLTQTNRFAGVLLVDKLASAGCGRYVASMNCVMAIGAPNDIAGRARAGSRSACSGSANHEPSDT